MIVQELRGGEELIPLVIVALSVVAVAGIVGVIALAMKRREVAGVSIMLAVLFAAVGGGLYWSQASSQEFAGVSENPVDYAAEHEWGSADEVPDGVRLDEQVAASAIEQLAADSGAELTGVQMTGELDHLWTGDPVAFTGELAGAAGTGELNYSHGVMSVTFTSDDETQSASFSRSTEAES